MTKLTNWMREAIAKAVMQHRFAEPCAALVADRAAFAVEVYEDVYSEADRRKMKSLPSGWLPELSSIRVQFGDGSRYGDLAFNGAAYSPIGKMLLTPVDTVCLRSPEMHERRCAKVYENEHPLCAKHEALEARGKALTEEIDRAQRQTEAAIASATTIGRLVEMWPEIEPFTADYGDKPKPVPAIPTADLNKLLKLPVAEAA